MSDTIDITPSPRVLRMLGQIDFAPWQCLAELIDNSIDAFLEGRAGRKPPTLSPRIDIEVPSSADLDRGSGEILVDDNGPGMTEEELANAIKAGYSGNDPVEKLGLFGMGFNIATARLGRRTEVWTTTADAAEWIGVEIDFDDLERKRTFAAPRLRQEKTDAELQERARGTFVRISKLEPTRTRALMWGMGKAATRRRLGKIYGRIMHEVGIELVFDGERVRPRRHCVWDERRSVPTAEFGNVPAVIEIEHTFDSGRFCNTCWIWLTGVDDACPACGTGENITTRTRSLKGWIGIQRYFDRDHYGIDLIRNGRVVEELDKSLFYWVDPETNDSEIEYPIDATHWGGRIVGELELDFVRVSHQKDAFDKLDPEWQRVVEVVRGVAPIRPHIARDRYRQLPPNNSPLARLFAGYRKGDAGMRWLVPGNARGDGINDRSIREWVEKFHTGDPDYQTDDKWFELVELAEVSKRGGSAASRRAAGQLPPPTGANAAGGAPTAAAGTRSGQTPVQANLFESDLELSRGYKLTVLPGAPEMHVDARRALSGLDGKPVSFDASASRVDFRYDPNHPFFEQSLESPLDCLVSDLAHRFLLMSGAHQREWPLSVIERAIRELYFPDTLTSLERAAEEARSILNQLREHLYEELPSLAPIDPQVVDPRALGLIRLAVLQQELGSDTAVMDLVREGRFAKYVDNRFVADSVRIWPVLVFDGRFVNVPYSDVIPDLQEQSLSMVHDALLDALWLVSDAGGGAISRDRGWRLRFARTLSSVRLLRSWMAS